MQKRYIPILWGREGEYRALQTLSPEVKGAVLPLIQIPPVEWDFVNDQPKKTVEEHLDGVVPKIGRAWGARKAWLDLYWVSEREGFERRSHPVARLFERAREEELRLVPVTGPDRDETYNRAVRRIVASDRRGVVIRVQLRDLDSDAADRVAELASSIGCDHDDTDLLVDVGPVLADSIKALRSALMPALQALCDEGEWRSLVLAAGAFPENLVNCAPEDATALPRNDWLLWRALLQRSRELPTVPIFADYAVANPSPSEVDPRIMKPSASIRYTSEEEWVVLKGRNLRRHGFEQFHEVCRDMIRRPEYRGAQFSWGDRYIRECARELTGPGNLTTWRQVGTSHHLTLVIDQLSSAHAR